MRKIVIGTRRSQLALTQTNWVIQQLKAKGVPYEFATKEIVTKGDLILDVTLSKVGGKGLFVKEIEQALHNETIDIAVHSMKDVPAKLPEESVLAAVPDREDPRDVLISAKGETLFGLPSGAVIGTSSLRRAAQLLHQRPDLQVKWIRGNVETRLRKLKEENFAAIVLAAAGLHRLGYEIDASMMYLPTEMCVPAVGQGALGLECRRADEEVVSLLQQIHDEASGRAIAAERAFLKEMDGSCQVPIGGFAEVHASGQLSLTGLVGSPDGAVVLKETRTSDHPEALGKEVAVCLRDQGATELLATVKDEL